MALSAQISKWSLKKNWLSTSKHVFLFLCFVSFVVSLLFMQMDQENIDSVFSSLFSFETVMLSPAIIMGNNGTFHFPMDGSEVTVYPTPNYDDIDQYQNIREKRGLKKILLWNAFFNKPDYGAGLGTSAFVRTTCPVQCWVTNDSRELRTSDAVIVHSYNLGPKFQNVSLPPRISMKQIFAFFILESPLKSYAGLRDVNFSFTDVFNLTMSYLDDPETDIRVPIGKALRKRIPEPTLVPRIRKLVRKRKAHKFVVWFVSNCQVFSARNEYVAELSKYIHVDVYGDCGTFSCPKNSSEDCFRGIAREYFFYLSFENSYCKDYMTEKAFRTLFYRMVPVVMGGGNYKKYLPRRSFIDVRDFTSPRTLAKYLHFLRENLEEYRKYFLWKAVYAVASEQWSKTIGFCKLCKILNNGSYPYKSNYNPLTYWDPDRWCLQGDDERRALHII